MNNIQRIRRERGISADWLAKNLSISTTTLSRYENGRRQPRAETLKAMATLFGCSMEELLKGD